MADRVRGQNPLGPEDTTVSADRSAPQVVADALAAHLAAYPAGADDSLFATTTGAVYRHDYYGSIILAKAVARAGLPTGTTSHDLRHHYASVLLAAGESVIAVAERLGHENATLVLETYGQLIPDSEDRTRRAVDAVWEPPRRSRRRRLDRAGNSAYRALDVP